MGRYSNFPQHLTQIERLVEMAQNPLSPFPRLRPVVPRIHKIEQRINPSVIARIAADYKAGMTTRELMATYQIGKGTLLRLLRNQGVDIRNQSLTAEQSAEAITLYMEGWSLAKIGRHFRREHTVIRDVLVRAGIPRRDSHGRPRQAT